MTVTKQKQLEMEHRRKQVAENVLAGLNYRDIGEALKVSIGTVSNDMKVVMARLRREQTGVAAEVIALEIRRIDRALNAIWKKVLSGDTRAIDTMLRLMDQRAKYLALTPEVHEITFNIEEVRQKRWNQLSDGLQAALNEGMSER